MSVVVTLLGRLGNNLFQYALGRIIAQHHGLALECQERYDPLTFMGQRVDYGPVATLPQMASSFPHAPLRMPGRRFETPVERFDFETLADWWGQTIDLASVLRDRSERQIRLAGYFQRYEYFVAHRGSLREWFDTRHVPLAYRVGPSDVLVSIRRGFDIGIIDWTLSTSYYRNILDGLRDIGTVYVCGTCIDGAVRDALARYRPVYVEGTPVEHFAFMQRFERIVLSNSTFAWWAAFLSDAVEIYAPKSPDGRVYGFTGWRDVDLHMREPRYIEVADVALAAFVPFTVTAAGSAFVRSVDGRAARGATAASPLDDDSLSVLRWLGSRAEPTSCDELRRHYGHLDLNGVFDRLVKHRFVSADTRYAN